MFAEVHAHLVELGFDEIGRDELFRAYSASDGRSFLIRAPNMHGYLTEVVVNDAFDAAGLPVRRWDVFFGD